MSTEFSNPNPIVFSKSTENKLLIERKTPGEDFIGKLHPSDIYGA